MTGEPSPPRVGGTGFHAWIADRDALAQLQLDLQRVAPGAAVVRIRGSRSRTLAGFFEESAAVLQFPWYAGPNLRAFADCLLSLGWLPGTAYVMLIEDAPQLLCEVDDHNLAALSAVLAQAHDAWERSTPTAPGRPFKVVFHATEAERDALARRLAAASVSIDPSWPAAASA